MSAAAVRTTPSGEVSLVDAVYQKYRGDATWNRNRCAARIKRHLQLHPYRCQDVQRYVFKNRGGRKDGTYVARPEVAEQIISCLKSDFGRKPRSAPGAVLGPRNQPPEEFIPALTRQGQGIVDATTALAELGPDTAETLLPAFQEAQTAIPVLSEVEAWGPLLTPPMPEYEFCGPEEYPFADQGQHVGDDGWVNLAEGYKPKFF